MTLVHQKEMMQKLVASEQKYSTLVNSMGEGLAVFDMSDEITFCNRATENIFGVESGKLLFRNMGNIIKEYDRDEWVYQKTLRKAEKSSQYDLRIVRLDGEIRYLIVSATPYRNSANQVVGTMAIFRDITARKQAEKEIAIFKNIIDNSNYGSAILNEAGCFTYLNRYFAELHGYTQEELINQDFSILESPELSKSTIPENSEINPNLKQVDILSKQNIVLKLNSNENNEPSEVSSKHKNGEVVPLLMNSIELKSNIDDSNLTAVVAMDISSQKENEKIIMESLKEKEILLMEVHHRVKNNMQIISSMLNMQMKSIKDEASYYQFKVCQTRIKSLSLIHEKLYHTKDFQHINFGDYVRSLVIILYQSYRNNCGYVHFEFEINETYLNINMAIPCALIINELITNSLKYAFPEKETGTITISLKKIAEQYNLIISDNGIGMKKDIDLVNPPTLGLTLVNSLTKQLHGKLELDKKLGTTIKISFGEVDLKSYNRLGSTKIYEKKTGNDR